MGVITALLIVIFVISAVFLVVVILLQDEQGEGLGGIFGGGSGTPFGSRSGNILTKTTSVLAAIFLFCSFAIAWLDRSPQVGDVVGAAKREQAKQGTAWWLTPVKSDATLPSAAGTAAPSAAAPAAGATGATTSAQLPAGGTSSTPTLPAPAAPQVPAAPASQAPSGTSSLAQ